MPENKPEAHKEILTSDDGSLVYFPMIGAMLNVGDEPAVKPSSPVEDVNDNLPYVEWGAGNRYRLEVEERAHNNTLIPSTLQFKANHLAAADLHYGYVDGYDRNGKPIIVRFDHEEIEAFWERNNKALLLQDGYRNLLWWSHGFGEYVMNKAKTKIVAISMQDTMHCNYSLQDKSGNKPYVYIDANWPNGSEDTWQKVRCIDPYHDWIGQMKTIPAVKFIYPLFFNSPGRTYYQRTPWHSVIDSKWLDLAEKIPEFKANLVEKQMYIKYVLHVPNDFWKTEIKNYDSLTDAQRIAARVAKSQEMSKALTGVERAGKALMLTYNTDYTQKQFAKWEVQELRGTLGDGAYIEDSQEASDHILYAMCFDGTLIGKTPGKGLGAGSGSDKRLADEIFFKNHKPYADKMIEFLNVLTSYNQWRGPQNKRIVWYMPEQILTTLNNVTPENRPGGK